MSACVGSRTKHDSANQAVRAVKRRIRGLRRQLLAETDPLAYYCALADAANAEVQLDYLYEQMGPVNEPSKLRRQPNGHSNGESHDSPGCEDSILTEAN